MLCTSSIHHPELEALRKQIDQLDEQLVRILSERVDLMEEIGRYKKAHGIAPLNQSRWQEVLKARMDKAIQLKLCPIFTQELYDLIHKHSLKVEWDIPVESTPDEPTFPGSNPLGPNNILETQVKPVVLGIQDGKGSVNEEAILNYIQENNIAHYELNTFTPPKMSWRRFRFVGAK